MGGRLVPFLPVVLAIRSAPGCQSSCRAIKYPSNKLGLRNYQSIKEFHDDKQDRQA